MMSESEVWRAWATSLYHRWRAHDERGVTTEGVIFIAIMALLAITVGGIITAKFLAKANSIPTG